MVGAQRILGLDVGAATVKIGEFQITKDQGLRLVQFGYAELGVDPEHEENRKQLLVSSISNMLREKSIKRGKTVFSVSGQAVFTRFVKLPPVDQSKVVQIIQYEAQQNVPFPIEEVCWDYQLIGSNPEGELDVVLLAIKNNIIEDLHNNVAAAGLKPVMVDVAPMALYNSVRYNYGDLEGCTVVLDIGARTTNLLFMEESKVFARSIPIAGNAITQSLTSEFSVPFLEADQLKRSGFVALGGAYQEPENVKVAQISKITRNIMTRLHAEVARSINFYRSQQQGSAPSRLFLSGGSSIIPYTDRFFQEKLNVPVEYFNPFRNVELAESINREELAECAHFFGEVVGLGLRQATECPIEVNLLPTSLREQRSERQRRPFLAATVVCLLLLPLAWWMYTSRVTGLKQQQLDEIKRQIRVLRDHRASIESEQAALVEIEAKTEQLLVLADNTVIWPALMQDISNRLVEGLYLTSLVPVQEVIVDPSAPVPTPGRSRGRGRSRGAAVAPPPPMIDPMMMDPTMMDPTMMDPTMMVPGMTADAAVGASRIEMVGRGTHRSTTEDISKVKEFADNLRSSGFFDEQGVLITELPSPMLTEEDLFFSFRISARLALDLPD